MKNNKIFWILGTILSIFIVGIAYIFFDDGKPNGSSLFDKIHEERLVEFTGSDLSESKDGKDIWKISARKILYNTESKEVILTDVEAFFIKDDNELHISAEKGIVAGDKSTVKLMGTISGKSKAGVTFEASNIVFDNQKKVILVEDGFTFKKDDITLSASKLEGDIVLETIKAMGNVRLTKEN